MLLVIATWLLLVDVANANMSCLVMRPGTLFV